MQLLEGRTQWDNWLLKYLWSSHWPVVEGLFLDPTVVGLIRKKVAIEHFPSSFSLLAIVLGCCSVIEFANSTFIQYINTTLAIRYKCALFILVEDEHLYYISQRKQNYCLFAKLIGKLWFKTMRERNWEKTVYLCKWLKRLGFTTTQKSNWSSIYLYFFLKIIIEHELRVELSCI